MLLKYFALDDRDADARQYVYCEIPCRYVFKKEKGLNVFRWEKRKAHFHVIGRMYSISPTQTELFQLRLLLLTVKGVKSFENLRTVNDKIYNTFVATCVALGLIDDDDEYVRAMNEAEMWMMPRQLRRMFIRILIHCQPLHPKNLWEEFKDAMSQDFARHMERPQAHRKAYIQVNTMLLSEGLCLDKFPGMQQITEIETMNDNMLPRDRTERGELQYRSLNTQQKGIVDIVLNAVTRDNEHNNHNCFYIDGSGGSGKTFIYTTLYHILKIRAKKISTMAFTGIAATLLANGRTVHKTFGMPVPLFSDSTSNIKNQTKEGEFLKNVDIFIWDEAPMAPKYARELVDQTLRDVMDNNLPFEGKIIVLGGDFRQLLPVKNRATRGEMVDLSIRFSPLCRHFKKFPLSQNIRTFPEEANFAKFLLDVGDGVLNDDDNNFIIPNRCLAIADSDIVDDIYGNLIREKRYEELANSAILSARNLDVEEIINRLWNYSTKHLKEYIQVLIVLKIVIIEILMKAFCPSTSIR